MNFCIKIFNRSVIYMDVYSTGRCPIIRFRPDTKRLNVFADKNVQNAFVMCSADKTEFLLTTYSV